jgi:tripartite-type tricarboxylate transporter receptor subunit TctC
MNCLSYLCIGFVLSSVMLNSSAADIAQSYPSKSIRFIVTYPAGASSDTLARIIGQRLTESWHQQVVIDNRGGGNTIIGTEIAAKSVPDGHTIFMGQVQNLAIVPCLYSKLPYDTTKDFAPVTFIGFAPLILVVYPGLPVNSVKELIGLAKSKPGQLKFPSSGSGGSTHLAGELFKSMTGVDMVHIPYQGGSAPLLAIMNGQVELGFDSIIQTLPHVRSGKLKVLGITSAKRSPAAPDVPTIAEAGVPGFEVAPWFGVAAPGGTPKEIVSKLNGEVNKIIHYPEVKEHLARLGVEPVGTTPEQFGLHIRTEITKWAKVVKDAGARVD